MTTDEKVEWMFNKLVEAKCSAGWVAEKLEYLGLLPTEHYLEAKRILMWAYEGETSLDEVKSQLRLIGVKV